MSIGQRERLADAPAAGLEPLDGYEAWRDVDLDPPEGKAAFDVYEVLGVRPDATVLLAREMYWSRIQPLLEPDRRDEPDARAAIEALNRALAIVCDADLRADYDAHRERREREPASRRAGTGHATPLARWLWRALLVVGLLSAVALLAMQSTWQVAAVAAGTCLVVITLVAGLARGGRTSTPHARLGVHEEAGRRDLEIAYRARAQELLLRLGADPSAVDALNRLDRDYLDAMRAYIAPETARRRGVVRVAAAVSRLLRPLLARGAALGWRASRRVGMTAGAGVVAASQALSRRVARAARGHDHRRSRDRLDRITRQAPAHEPGRGVGTDRESPAEPARRPAARGRVGPPGARAAEASRAPAIDLERRLAASLKASTLEIASAPAGEPHAGRGAEPLTPAHLLLFASAGVRRVPIAERPIRIGSAGECDLVLPEREGVRHEHALVWRRGDAVVLHVTDPAGECLVNNRACTWATLEHGDELRLGNVELKIEIDEASVAPTESPPSV